MKYLKLFESHIHGVTNEAEVAKICIKYDIRNWTLNSDSEVDVDGSVNLACKLLTKLPLKFGRVEGDFWCNNNKLTSLEGSPNYVGGFFATSTNQLTSLVGCPRYIGRDFYSRSNNIRSFEGIGHIGRQFYCGYNPINCFWNLFRDTSKIETFNEWGVIQDDKVILYRLNDFLAEIGRHDVTENELNDIKKDYTVI